MYLFITDYSDYFNFILIIKYSGSSSSSNKQPVNP